jgi:hypothetical protein
MKHDQTNGVRDAAKLAGGESRRPRNDSGKSAHEPLLLVLAQALDGPNHEKQGRRDSLVRDCRAVSRVLECIECLLFFIDCQAVSRALAHLDAQAADTL